MWLLSMTQLGSKMPKVTRLVTQPERLSRELAAMYREDAERRLRDPSSTVEMVRSAEWMLTCIERYSVASEGLDFGMIDRVKFGAVIRRLRLESVRPAVACDLWAMCMRFVVPVTGEVEVNRNRKVFLDELGISSAELSRLLTELVDFAALRRERVPGVTGYCYFLNPSVASYKMPAAARERESGKFPALSVVGGGEPPTERRSRAARVAPVVL